MTLLLLLRPTIHRCCTHCCRVDNQRIVTNRPLAGTRRRGQNPADDLALEKELLADSKECAEHVMLVDLGRNDVGKVAEHGSVVVRKVAAALHGGGSGGIHNVSDRQTSV